MMILEIKYKKVKTVNGNLIIWNKYRWNIEKWIMRKLMSLIFERKKFMSRWSQSLVNVRSPSYLKQKTFDDCL